MINETVFNIVGSIIGLALVFGLMYGGWFSYKNYRMKIELGKCLDGDGKIGAYGGLIGGLVAGLALLIFIIIQWCR